MTGHVMKAWREGMTVRLHALEPARPAGYGVRARDVKPGIVFRDGRALVKGVAGRHGNLPIIIVTGFPSLRTAMASIELPVSTYLVKPVTFPNLASRIEQAISRYRAFRRTDERLEQMNLLR